MKIIHHVEIRIYQKKFCRNDCPHLQFITAYCGLFEKNLDFGIERYLRTSRCLKAKRAV